MDVHGALGAAVEQPLHLRVGPDRAILRVAAAATIVIPLLVAVVAVKGLKDLQGMLMQILGKK